MTDIDDRIEHQPTPVGSGAARSHRLIVVLCTVIAVAALTLATAMGVLWGRSQTSSSNPAASSVDAGFARDMATHHQQAITMAAYARDNSTDTAVKTVAFDIESSQSVQMGELIGWLQQWDVSRNTTSPMSWMPGHHLAANALMPGMATPAQLAKLQTLHGKALDILFLQLMIHHHQGGKDMAQYAAAHSTKSYVQTLAQQMYNNQTAEIVQMEQMLRQLGASPLPAP
jgi:uncharacterized protein (DUF305 family)